MTQRGVGGNAGAQKGRNPVPAEVLGGNLEDIVFIDNDLRGGMSRRR